MAPKPGKTIHFDLNKKYTKILKETKKFNEFCISSSVPSLLINTEHKILIKISGSYTWGQGGNQWWPPLT